jgi:hypothetical protein
MLFLVMASLGFHSGNVAASPITVGGYSLISGHSPSNFTDTTKSFIASRFTVGASNVEIGAINYFIKGNGTINPSIAIYSAKSSGISGGFEPNSLIAGSSVTFSAGPSTSVFTPITINFTNAILLAASTDYYVVVNGTSDTGVYIPSTGQSSQFSTVSNGVTPQTRLLAYSSAWASFSSASFIPYELIQQDSSPVPAPGTSLLMVMGLALLRITWRITNAK